MEWLSSSPITVSLLRHDFLSFVSGLRRAVLDVPAQSFDSGNWRVNPRHMFFFPAPTIVSFQGARTSEGLPHDCESERATPRTAAPHAEQNMFEMSILSMHKAFRWRLLFEDAEADDPGSPRTFSSVEVVGVAGVLVTSIETMRSAEGGVVGMVGPQLTYVRHTTVRAPPKGVVPSFSCEFV